MKTKAEAVQMFLFSPINTGLTVTKLRTSNITFTDDDEQKSHSETIAAPMLPNTV